MILDKIYCGLDIGNHSLKASLVRVKAPNRYELLETLEAPTRGFKKSYVSDLGEFSESIHRVLKELTRKSAGKFKGVHLGLGGHTVEMRYSKALIPLVDKASKVITTGDLKKVNKQSRLLGIKMDEEILHDFPQQYLINDTNRILNPAGLYGRKLGVTSLLVISQSNLIGNITKALNQAGFEVSNIFFSSLAAAQTALSRDHIQKGSLLIDIGATTTNILFFKDGFLRHLDILPFGGQHLTDSIAASLQVPFDLAEQINNSKLELLEIEKQVGNVHWIVTYEPDYDVAYIGFSEKVKNLPLKTKQGRGSILIGKKGQILGFEFNISELF